MRLLLIILAVALAGGIVQAKENFTFKDLEGIQQTKLSDGAAGLLKKNGFVALTSRTKKFETAYGQAKKNGQPQFITVDTVLHAAHIYFDYTLRILEMRQLYPALEELSRHMVENCRKQYEETEDEKIKEIALLNAGYFSVARRLFEPEYRLGLDVDKLANKELENIEAMDELYFRELCPYVDPHSLISTPYAYEDYSQYRPRGHYTRNEKFKTFFKVMMWYSRIDFKLRPTLEGKPRRHGRDMTLQAMLMTEALRNDERSFELWKKIYETTAFFVGESDDLTVHDYGKLIDEIFGPVVKIHRFSDKDKIDLFIKKAFELCPPKILSGAAFAEEGHFASQTMGFRFMGQRFIPDSYIFQQLVFRSDEEGNPVLRYKGKTNPFTKETIPNYGPVRAFPRGLDICAVYGSDRALEILKQEGDTAYTDYGSLLSALKKEMHGDKTVEDWEQNLYWRWIYSLLPLLDKPETVKPGFMQTQAWLDLKLNSFLGSWTELRHDTILYAKQSYGMMGRGAPSKPSFTYGYVEPYPEVYERISKMMFMLRTRLSDLGIDEPDLYKKFKELEKFTSILREICRKQSAGIDRARNEYDLIWNYGKALGSILKFPKALSQEILGKADESVEIIADVHTDLNTKQVLEEGVGPVSDLYVIMKDDKGYRLMRGAVYSYYEFKQDMKKRLSDEDWQQLGRGAPRPGRQKWQETFLTDR